MRAMMHADPCCSLGIFRVVFWPHSNPSKLLSSDASRCRNGAKNNLCDRSPMRVKRPRGPQRQRQMRANNMLSRMLMSTTWWMRRRHKSLDWRAMNTSRQGVTRNQNISKPYQTYQTYSNVLHFQGVDKMGLKAATNLARQGDCMMPGRPTQKPCT